MLCSRICQEDNDSQIVTMPAEIVKLGRCDVLSLGLNLVFGGI